MTQQSRGYHLAHSFLIPSKANLVLHLILIVLLLIGLRVWHLTVIQHKERVEAASKPQQKVIYEPAKRGTIRDRFGIPLAINKMQYNVSILYSQIKLIPTVAWEEDEEGNRIKRYKRKEYIKDLSAFLAQELSMDEERIEDLVYAKATFYNQIPFVLKTNISERQYYRLKMMEKDWPGIHVYIAPYRYYPQGENGSDLIGYIGPIDRNEYEAIIGEMKMLREVLQELRAGSDAQLPDGFADEEQIEERIHNLQELAYSLNDVIGKSGIEGKFERELRGYRGKKRFFSDAKGQFLRPLPGTQIPQPGNQLVLTISSELQDFANKLLIQNETIRPTRLARLGGTKRTTLAGKEPWIKGGAIIAMDPNTGDILAMASHPHYNSNDFILDAGDSHAKKENLLRWLENETYIAAIWDGKRPMEREKWRFKNTYTLDTADLTWDSYLEIILAKDSTLLNLLTTRNTLKDALQVQRAAEELVSLEPEQNAYRLFHLLYPSLDPYGNVKKLSPQAMEAFQTAFEEKAQEVAQSQKKLDPYISSLTRLYDLILLIDLYRLAAPANLFSEQLMLAVGNQSLSEYKQASSAMAAIQAVVKEMARDVFHQVNFKEWRALNEKAFLKSKRDEEKRTQQYAKPYIDYLDQKEQEFFQEFWKTHSLTLTSTFLGNRPIDLPSDSDRIDVFLNHFDTWHREVQQGAHQDAPWFHSYLRLNEMLSRLPHELIPEYLATLRSYQQLDRPLFGEYRSLRKPSIGKQTEKQLAAAFYPKHGYGYARPAGFRQAATQGSIFKLVTSYAALIQQFKALKNTPITSFSLNPMELIDNVHMKGNELFVGYDVEGKPIPRFYKGGRLPKSALTSIGKIDLIKAIEMSSNPYFAMIAGDFLKTPQDLSNAAAAFSYGKRTGIDLPGEISGSLPTDLDTNRTGLYSFAIGQHTLVVTPLQTAVMLSTLANGGKVLKPKIVSKIIKESENSSTVELINTHIHRHLFMPAEVKNQLIHGMCRVVVRNQRDSINSLSRLYRDASSAIRDYTDLKYEFVGKTSTSESVETIDLDPVHGTNLYTHVWFGGILYDSPIFEEPNQRFVFKDNKGNPELVVVTYLRYGGYGKEAAPVAAQVAKKWREIKKKQTLMNGSPLSQ